MATLLIAGNFLREHRWPVVILLAWIVFTTLATAGVGQQRVVADDVVFFVQQQAVYICGFTAFLAANAINNERKSRRILLVLSKAVSRGEYLLALLSGTEVMAVIYAALFAVCCTWLASRADLPTRGIWIVAVLVAVGSAVSAAVGMFFSTFLNPYLAMAMTVALFGAPGALHAAHRPGLRLMPGLPVLAEILCFRFHPDWTMHWGVVAIAVIEAALFWGLAAVVFSYKDIAVPVE
jgi:ABC-type transport system involved in multi-copper enzyme maturation permease subunit